MYLGVSLSNYTPTWEDVWQKEKRKKKEKGLVRRGLIGNGIKCMFLCKWVEVAIKSYSSNGIKISI